MFKNKNVLVSGGAGLTGQESIRQLLDIGANVRATEYKHRKIKYVHKNLEIVSCDLIDYDQCKEVVKDIDIVINCSAFIFGAKGQIKHSSQLIRKNLVPDINLIEASCIQGVEKFAFIGSSTAYPESKSDFLKEDEAFTNDPPLYYEGFGWMKRYCEKVCMHFHHTTKTKFAMVRTGAVYGPWASFDPEMCQVVPSMIMKAYNKTDPFDIWGDGTQQRDFVYVSDLIDGLLCTIEKYAVADPINIATGQSSTVNDLVSVILKKYKYSPKINYLKTEPNMAHTRVLNVEKANAVLGWRSKVSLEEGISKTIDWYNLCE